MSGTPDSAGPKLYHRPMSKWWWLQSRVYFLFIVRELTCIFVGYFALVMMWLIHALGQGPDAYAQFTAWMQTRTFSVLNSVALVFLLFHSITWFTITPRTLILRFVLGENRVPNWAFTGTLYLVSIVWSAVVAWLLLRL